jgi:two-component system chemotaxis sensor kinase CheA
MQPIGKLFNSFKRVVMDLSLKLDKKIDFIVKDNRVEIDKSIIEIIKDPLTHIIRNSIDHGIEEKEIRYKRNKEEIGKIEIIANEKEGFVNITIKDDGNGIDIEKVKDKIIKKNILSLDILNKLDEKEIINYIFHPGFSTKDSATDISGRGVGMDIVKNNLKKVQGEIFVETEYEKGTIFLLELPLSIEKLSITPSLIFIHNESYFAIEQSSIRDILLIKDSKKRIVEIDGLFYFNYNNENLHLKDFNIFSDEKVIYNNKFYILIVEFENRKLALKVEKVYKIEEIVVKPMVDIDIDSVFQGTAVLGNEKISLFINNFKLFGIKEN